MADPGTTFAGVAARFDDGVQAVADSAVVKHTGPIEEVSLGYWSRGRVLLVGDTAHATPPSLAQGAAMAMEDVHVLGELPRAAPSIPTALRAHELRRGSWVGSSRASNGTVPVACTRGAQPLAPDRGTDAVPRELPWSRRWCVKRSLTALTPEAEPWGIGGVESVRASCFV
ncbi:FAD-dependent monooxygenase [Promicromonospora sp. NPDC057488]|uniref:FAD-dependent monooxygenase n=1 Tax=Promicromonospora sp. NPDC057488 TaxID=3346147 RepID=UPI0036709554